MMQVAMRMRPNFPVVQFAALGNRLDVQKTLVDILQSLSIEGVLRNFLLSYAHRKRSPRRTSGHGARKQISHSAHRAELELQCRNSFRQPSPAAHGCANAAKAGRREWPSFILAQS